MKRLSMFFLLTFLFVGCTSKTTLPKVSYEEMNNYENIYINEYSNIRKTYIKPNKIEQWVQANNKKEDCKLFVSYGQDDVRQKPDYKIYWDGECKDGYAYGLGREFLKGMMLDVETIAIYSGGKVEPKYYYQFDKLNYITIKGDINNQNIFIEYTNEDTANFNIMFEYRFTDESNLVTYMIKYYPINKNREYIKAYPNFRYKFSNYEENKLETKNWVAELNDINLNTNGYVLANFKSGETVGAEVNKNRLVKKVELPTSYFEKFNTIANDIIKYSKNTQSYVTQANLVKKQYKLNICKDDISVNYIDNKEYKDICFEDKRNFDIKNKIDNEIAKIDKLYEKQIDQMTNEVLLKARVLEAESIERNAKASEVNNLNQIIHNTNQNLQLQQLNNNIMMNNFFNRNR